VREATPQKRAIGSNDRRLLVAFLAGGVLAAALGALFQQRASRDRPASPSAPSAGLAATSGGSAEPPSSASTARSIAALSASASAGAPPSLSAAASAPVPAPADLDACIATWFPPASLDPDTDLSFLCSEPDGRRGTIKLRRAIVTGARAKSVTPAMVQWASLGWFELPVYATLRAQCCQGAPPIDLPHPAGSSCEPPRDALQALGVATAAGGDLTGPIRAYRKAVSCLVEVGDFPAYGRDGPIGGAEETAFRAFAERGAKR